MELCKCVVCKTEKEPEEFNWKNKQLDQRKNYCRDCDKVIKKRHYYNNKEKIIAETRQRQAKNAERFQQWKATLQCVVCDENEPACLDFHHLDPSVKEFQISAQMPWMNWNNLMKEVDKCVCVCKNCHAKIHKYGIEQVQQSGYSSMVE